MARSDDAQHDLDDLGALLRTHRKRAQLTGSEAARRAGFTQSKLSKVENGILLPSPDDVRRLAAGLGMDPDATARALDLVERLWADRAGQRGVLRRSASNEHAALLTKFSATGHVVAADPAVVPDWLRTHDYLAAAAGPQTERDAARVTALARKRQRLLETPGFRFEFFVFESALRTHVGSLRIMADQLRTAAATAGHGSNVIIRLVNDEALVTPLPQHAFEMHDDRQIVLSTAPGVVVITSNNDIRPYRRTVISLRDRALSEDRSRHYLRQVGGLYDVLDRIDRLAS
ncbi:Scr1 family TA system antitoxin-like transcriptional regulator [Lentzea sp. NPDC004782]|uniref:Scr1 family TA system antitoxin-like transcriptional regulator n=1 Tax=Lentzea sp. NPDC004782 TaxID=3154458 RepID=UPI0033BB1358